MIQDSEHVFKRGKKNTHNGIFSEKDPINLNIPGFKEENLLLKAVLKITPWKVLDRDERKMEWKREKIPFEKRAINYSNYYGRDGGILRNKQL